MEWDCPKDSKSKFIFGVMRLGPAFSPAPALDTGSQAQRLQEGEQNIFGNVVGQGKRAAASMPGVREGVGSSRAIPREAAVYRSAPHPHGGQ